MSRTTKFACTLFALAALAHLPAVRAAEKYPPFGNIVRKDPRLDKLVPPGEHSTTRAPDTRSSGFVRIASSTFRLPPAPASVRLRTTQ